MRPCHIPGDDRPWERADLRTESVEAGRDRRSAREWRANALDAERWRLPSEDVLLLLTQASLKSWVVYSKPPVAGADQVIDYLGRYTHRIAISNERLVSLKEGHVTFRWKDRARGNQEKLLTLELGEFLRRFLLHVLPRGLMRIRHYGFLANAVRRREIERCRALVGTTHEKPPDDPPRSETWQQTLLRLTGRDVTQCPNCRQGRLEPMEILPPARRRFVTRGAAS